MERGNNPYRQETTMQDGWVKIGVLGCNSVRPRNVGEPPTGDGTAVGNAASAASADSLAAGDGAEGSGAGAVALGSGASARHESSVALGSRSATSKANEVSLGAPATGSAPESTREVTHVSEPTAPTSAATKAYVDDINVIAPKTVETKPVSGNALCVAIGDGAVTEVKAGREFAPVAIGASSKSTGMHAVAIGAGSVASGAVSVSLGSQASANAAQSSAIGPGAHSYGAVSIAGGFVANSIDAGTIAIGSYSQGVKNNATAVGTYASAVGNYSVAIGGTCSTCSSRCVAIGMNSSVVGSKVPDPNVLEFEPNGTDSVALGSFSVADDYRTVSVGNDVESVDHWYRVIDGSGQPTTVAPFWVKNTVTLPAKYQHIKRRIIHVADPVDGHNAATKDYVDANTSNAFMGTALGKTLHVEDAWPSKPIRLSFVGACKQDGTPSPESPVPIEVVESPVLRVTGKDTSAAGASLPVALPAEHPFLAVLPDNKTADMISIEKDGTATLTASVGKTETAATDGVSATVGTDALSSTGVLADGATVYYKLAKPVTYQLGKLDVPALPETVSNVWVEAALAPEEMFMEYKRDANLTGLHSSSSITIENGTAEVDPSIFGNGLSVATTGNVSVNMATVSKSIAGHGLSAIGGKVKVNTIALASSLAGDGLTMSNGQLKVDVGFIAGDGLSAANGQQITVDTASATKRGAVRVGSGLSIDADGVLSATGQDIDGVIVKKRTDFTVTEAGSVDEVSAGATDTLLVRKSAGNGSYSYGVMKTGLYFRLAKTYAAGTKLEFNLTASVGGVKAYFGNQRIFMLFHKGNVLFASSYSGIASYELKVIFDVTETLTVGDYVYMTFI